MCLAFYFEYRSFKKKPFKDYKSVIISIGVFGTFVGIFCGLWNFNTENITESVPTLLAGLKLAFVTSILGMFFSILLSFIENYKKESSDDDPDQGSISLLTHILTEHKIANKKISLIRDTIKNSDLNIARRFDIVNESLKEALDVLSKGATEEIITALERVISDFNKNLTHQFGDNFKQLNESVKNMIIWQENYKVSIEQIEKNLQIALQNIEKTSNHMQVFADNYEKISDISKDLKQVIDVNQNQIKNIETHMVNLKKIGDEASLITASINDFSKSIQSSLSNQSEGLNKLSDELIKQMGSSLGNLNTALTSLTDKFRDDYDRFLKSFKELIEFKESIEKMKK